jgi:hypothetical protein
MQAKMTKTVRVQQQQRLAAAPQVRSCKPTVQCQASRREIINIAGSATLLLAGNVLPALAEAEPALQQVQAVAAVEAAAAVEAVPAVADAEIASSSSSTQTAPSGGKQVWDCESSFPFAGNDFQSVGMPLGMVLVQPSISQHQVAQGRVMVWALPGPAQLMGVCVVFKAAATSATHAPPAPHTHNFAGILRCQG